MLSALITGLALAGTPCEPTTRPDVLEGENFWIEWDPAVGDAALAQANLDWAEEARRVYIEDMGYDYPDATVLIELEDSISAGGLTTTVTCPDGSLAPHITLFATSIGQPGKNTTMHEVAHAVQYAYMGSYIDGITSWNWWMEGHATWLTWFADGDDLQRALPARGYLDAPWVGLHQTPLAYADSTTSRFLYGTVLVVEHLEATHGADVVRQTWEVGGPQSGTPIDWPSTLEAVGVAFEPFWQGFLAETVVLDREDARYYWPDGMFVEKRVGSLPAEGGPSDDTVPQGLGVSAVHFRKAAGASGRDLHVHFEGDPSVDWVAILVLSRGKGPEGKVDEIVPLSVVDGVADGVLPGFDGVREGFLVVSPVSKSLEGHDYTWSAELRDPSAEEGAKGCGCSGPGPGPLPWLLLPLALGFRRR